MEKSLHDEIAKLAHDFHVKRGLDHGHDKQDWLEAERIVLARYEKGTEKEKTTKSSKATTKKGK